MLALLARASLEGALLAAGVWMVCRALPRLSAAVRSALWWCVAAKFVVSLLWIAPIGVPVLPADAARTGHGETRGAAVAREASFPRAADVTARGAVASRVATPNGAEVPWTPVVLSLWGAGLAVVLLRTARQWRDTRGVVSRAVPADAALQETARDLAGRLGLRRAAEVMLSTEIDSPLITGVRRTVILVPADRFALLSPEQQRMALCHELAHMKRGDLWLGCVPALVERCFFFHPLARLAAREYAFWREAACDEAVLVVLGASPQAYGRLLLALGVSRQPATFAAAGAAWSFSTLKRRIVMLGHPTSSSSGGRLLATSAVALAVLAIAPVKAVARTSSSAPEPAVSPTEVESVASTVRPIAAPGVRVASPATVVRPALRAAEVAAPALAPELVTGVAPGVARAADARGTDARVDEAVAAASGEPDIATGVEPGLAVSTSSQQTPDAAPVQERRRRDEVQFVYFHEDRNTTISGFSADVREARRLRRSDERMLWFRRDGQEYVVRDREVLDEFEEIWEEVNRIGAELGRLGARQGELGAEQGRHGAKQGKVGAAQGLVGARQGVIGARLGLLATREAAGASAAERRAMDREREELERDMRALDREMEALSRKMRDIEPPSADVGREMTALGRQMDAVSRRMDAASRRADSEMQALVDRAIRNRTAQPVR